MMGMLGSNITSDTDMVWITKTHYPQAMPNSKPFAAQKMIVMARNPIDVIPSFANLLNTHSHSLEVNEAYHVDFPEFWQPWVAQMIESMRQNHDEVLNSIARRIPTYFIRYEDLKQDPVPVLKELFCFLLNVPSIEGTVVEKRIIQVSQSGFQTKAAYALKSTSGSLSRSNHMYSAEQINLMKTKLADMIRFWNYDQDGYPGERASASVSTNFFDMSDVLDDGAGARVTFRGCNRELATASGASYEFNKEQKLM